MASPQQVCAKNNDTVQYNVSLTFIIGFSQMAKRWSPPISGPLHAPPNKPDPPIHHPLPPPSAPPPFPPPSVTYGQLCKSSIGIYNRYAEKN
jgi:hypothetical protein